MVRAGADGFLLPGNATLDSAQEVIRRPGPRAHTALNVYAEMLLQIAAEYASLPPIDDLTIIDLVFFYDGQRGNLRSATKPRET